MPLQAKHESGVFVLYRFYNAVRGCAAYLKAGGDFLNALVMGTVGFGLGFLQQAGQEGIWFDAHFMGPGVPALFMV